MKKPQRFGLLPPRYTFSINTYLETRFTKCPNCRRPNFTRKFPLLIHIDNWGLLTLGKTCRYCAKCEFIIVHQNELEGELAAIFTKRAPEIVGNKYLVLGTVEKKFWRKAMTEPDTLEDLRQHTADFKKRMTLMFDPGGWRPNDPAKVQPPS